MTMFGFLAALVGRCIFEKVQLGFLPVGHTHDEIDAWFSKICKQVMCVIDACHLNVDSSPGKCEDTSRVAETNCIGEPGCRRHGDARSHRLRGLAERCHRSAVELGYFVVLPLQRG